MRLLLSGLSLFSTLGFASKAELPFPGPLQSIEVVYRSATAVTVIPRQGAQEILASVKGQSSIVSRNFHPAGKTRIARFGTAPEAVRKTIKKGKLAQWAAIIPASERVLLVDGRVLVVFEMMPKTMRQVIKRSIIIDSIRPPADRGGEAPEFEVNSTKSRFLSAYRKTKRGRIAGMALYRKREKSTEYFAVSRIPGFPLLTVSCDNTEPSRCKIDRHCFLAGASALKANAISGVGYHPQHRLLVIGDADRHALRYFRVSSCYQISALGVRALPKKIKRLNNLWVDGDRRLWAAMDEPDPLLNSSIYYWPESIWVGDASRK